MAFRKESLAGVSLHGKRLVFVAELIPESVKLGIVGPVYIVCQFVEHGVDDLFHGEKLILIARISEAKAYSLARTDIQSCQCCG
jgi:hypothetical protein